MIVCVIGCTGYLGSKISVYLNSQGHKVIGVCKKFPKKNKKFKKNFFKIIEGDITNLSLQKKILSSSFSSIVYTISLNQKDSEKNFYNSINVNYIPLQNICNHILKKNLKIRIIYFSTSQVYGDYSNLKLITEKTKKNPKNIYGLTHSMCEDILETFSKYSDSQYTSLRLSNGYGYPELKSCNCWWLAINDFCSDVQKKNQIKITSNGTPIRDFIHISDIALTVQKLLLLKKKIPKVLNLCSGKSISLLEIANVVQKKSYTINKNPTLYVKGKKITKKNLIKKIYILKNKNRFRISNNEMKKLNIRTKIDISNGIKKTLIELERNNNRLK